MKWLFIPIIIFLSFDLHAAVDHASKDDYSNCIECHQKTYLEYQRSQMAFAAKTSSFLAEWERKGHPEMCFDCHSPTRSEGIACIDCHGIRKHPYPEVDVIQICSKCHDAPGEITVHSFRHSASARRGEDCLDCHLDFNKTGHEFIGPSTKGFLNNIASLRASIRRRDNRKTAIINIRHTAGHALPGGTTGRSVWLIVNEISEGHILTDTTKIRFGWFYDSETGWINKTIKPDAGKIIELPLKGKRTQWLHAQLIYRFVPGYLNEYDPEQVLLDEINFQIE